MVKFAVLGYDTINIGDDIQSLVTSTLIAIDYIILRDNYDFIYDFTTGIRIEQLEEDVYLIMNGWFMHNTEKNDTNYNIKFPFDNIHIKPIYISTCLSIYCHELFQSSKIEHFKQYEPIYARDTETVAALLQHGVNSIFYGCLTQTLDINNIPDNNEYKSLYSNTIFIVDSNINIPSNENVIYVNHYIKELRTMNPVERMKIARDMLCKYKYAKKIYTGRLHCFLPCRAMGLDVEYTGELCYRTKDLIPNNPDKQAMLNIFYKIINNLT